MYITHTQYSSLSLLVQGKHNIELNKNTLYYNYPILRSLITVSNYLNHLFLLADTLDCCLGPFGLLLEDTDDLILGNEARNIHLRADNSGGTDQFIRECMSTF